MKALPHLIAIIFVLCLSGPTQGEDGLAFWSEVRQRMNGNSGYSLRCDYVGPEGRYFFDYVVHGSGERIYTEVLEGSTRGAGTKVYYNPLNDSENVHMQTRIFRLRRSLQARDIKDSPLYIPLFSHLLEEICEPEPSEVLISKEGHTIFRFGKVDSRHEFLEVDPKGNPLTIKRMVADKEINSLTFRDLEWGEKPFDWKE